MNYKIANFQYPKSLQTKYKLTFFKSTIGNEILKIMIYELKHYVVSIGVLNLNK